MEPQPPIAGAPEPPRSPELDRLVRQVLAPGSTSDHILLTADALDEAAQHLPNPDAAAHRRVARLLRDAAPHWSGAAHPRFVTVIDEITAERRRQIEVEGWTPEHDDVHSGGQLIAAAWCYLGEQFGSSPADGDPPAEWPWEAHWWKPKDHRRDLIRAAALVVAEIERLDRRELRLAEVAP